MSSTIIVTGAARGMGAAISLKLLEQGHQVVGIDAIANTDQWEITQNLKQTEHENWHPYTQDITDFEATQVLISEVLSRFNVTGLVNAAGILIMTSLVDAQLADWQKTMAVNVQAPIVISQQVAKYLSEKNHGSIVTISSNSARMPRLQLGMYATSKAALSHFSRNLGLEVAPHRVRVNIVSPGSTLTHMQKQLWVDDQPPKSVLDGDLEQYRTGIPLRKMAEANDIANTVVFLLSEQASQITMQEIVIDGGATLGV